MVSSSGCRVSLYENDVTMMLSLQLFILEMVVTFELRNST